MVGKPVVFHPDGKPFSGDEVIEVIKQVNPSNKIMLAFSCGKDSLAAWLKLREHFEIVPFYLYSIKGLSFVDESLAYYEKFFGTHIIQLPHPSLYRMLNNFVFQSPDRVAVIRSANLPNFDYDDISRLVQKHFSLPKDTYTANGIRAADSPNRRGAISKYGAVNYNRRYFYPVWDMKLDELVFTLQKSGVKLPIDYELFGRSFDGIDHRFISVIKKKLPEDYQKILDWFPLVELELMRYEQAENHRAQ